MGLDEISLIIAGLALVVAVSNAVYDRSKDRARIDIRFAALGRDAVELSVINAGHRPLYVMDILFTRYDGGDGHQLWLDWTIVEDHVVEQGRARVLQPWQPLQYIVPADGVRRHVESGRAYISVYDSRRRVHREAIPDQVRRVLSQPPDVGTQRP